MKGLMEQMAEPLPAVSRHDLREPRPDRLKAGSGWYALAVLFMAYLLSLMDRMILSLMVEPIRRDFSLTDTQISLLQGLAFALFYTLMGLPIAVLADRYNRKRIVVVGMIAWSMMTAFCGIAQNFSMLFLGRIGVGTGEATLSPSAYSIISDSFPRERVTRATSVYSTSGFIGPGLALLVGGSIVGALSHLDHVTLPLLGTFRPWQVTFLILGAAGVPFTLLLLTLKEPVRRSKPGEDASVAAWLCHLRAHWGSYFCLMAGESLVAVAGYGGLGWVPTIFVRVHHLPIGTVGLVNGIIVAATGTAGVMTGARLAERLRERGIFDAIPRVMALGAGASVPFFFLLLSSNDVVAFVGMGLFYFFNSLPWGVCGAGIQLTTPDRLRAKAAATLLLATNLVGLGLGPTVPALITDYIFGDPQMVAVSFVISGSAASVIACLLIRWGLPRFHRALSAAERAEPPISGVATQVGA
jgi:MFS family permease